MLVVATMLSLNTSVFASDFKDPEVTKVDQMYADIYDTCSSNTYSSVTDDYSAYAYLIQNISFLTSTSPLAFSEETFINLDSTEKEIVDEFIEKINNLIELDAIQVHNNLLFTMPDAPTNANVPVPNAIYFSLMPEARSHANELRSVYNNAPFDTRVLVAGAYFTVRVAEGGVWDYKRYMGLNTLYYEPELDTTMTGETIGNFHYGYVGSAVFGPTTLKSAAGLVQILSGTSNISYYSSYFDDPRDQTDIEWGIRVYNQEH